MVAGKQAVEERRKAVKNAEEAQVAEGKARKSAQEAAVQQGKAEASQEVAETARDSLNETLTRSYFLTAKQFLDTGDLDNGWPTWRGRSEPIRLTGRRRIRSRPSWRMPTTTGGPRSKSRWTILSIAPPSTPPRSRITGR